MSKAHTELSQIWKRTQISFFPQLEETLEPLTNKQQQLVTILEFIRIEEHLRSYDGALGRRLKD
ncbi:MAG: hypothetical protein R8K49_03695 [Mariprofundaceae bacterium]